MAELFYLSLHVTPNDGRHLRRAVQRAFDDLQWTATWATDQFALVRTEANEEKEELRVLLGADGLVKVGTRSVDDSAAHRPRATPEYTALVDALRRVASVKEQEHWQSASGTGQHPRRRVIAGLLVAIIAIFSYVTWGYMEYGASEPSERPADRERAALSANEETARSAGAADRNNVPLFGVRALHVEWNDNPLAAEGKYLHKRIRIKGSARRTGRSQYDIGRYGRLPYLELGETTLIYHRETDSVEEEYLSLKLYLSESQLPKLAALRFPTAMTVSCVVDGTDDETYTIPIPMLSACVMESR